MRRFTLKIAALAWLLLVYAIFVGTFLTAYASDGAVRVVIDRYGEAELELALLALGAVVVAGGAGLLAADAVEKMKSEVRLQAAAERVGEEP